MSWLRSRAELLAPALGVLLFFVFALSTNATLTIGKVLAVLLMAAVYAGLVIRSPMALPEKEPRPVEIQRAWKTVLAVLLVVAIGVGISAVLPSGAQEQTDQSGTPWTQYFSLFLIVVLGTAGILSEHTLPVDLFPVFRQRRLPYIVYVLVAAFSIAVILFLVGSLFMSIAGLVGSLFGETPPAEESMSGFGSIPWYALLLHMVIGAGIFEELWFRVGIMTTVWALTQRWGWGLLVSSILFGLYHITLSSMAAEFNQTPIYSVLYTTGMGAVMGCIYRYRGLTMAVLIHSLGNFLSILLLTQ
jgi:membrane protease YdiL (CAAX protease family)